MRQRVNSCLVSGNRIHREHHTVSQFFDVYKFIGFLAGFTDCVPRFTEVGTGFTEVGTGFTDSVRPPKRPKLLPETPPFEQIACLYLTLHHSTSKPCSSREASSILVQPSSQTGATGSG